MLHKIKQINNQIGQVAQYERNLDIFEGNLNKYVSESLSRELSAQSFKVASTRIPSINLMRRIVKKLSRVYTYSPTRTTLDPRDQEYVDLYSQSMGLQNQMSNGEDLLNLNKCFALEPYLEEGKFEVRVLAPHEFTVLSEDPNDPTEMTTFVKYMGSYNKIVDKDVRLVNTYHLVDKDFLTVVNSDGDVLQQLPNPYGVIPFVYVNSSSFCLKPIPDLDFYDNTVLIPKLLCDLNYSTQFQSHSMIYSIDANINGAVSGAPDSMLNISSTEGSTKSASIGTISPTVDVDKVLALITFTVSQWLESKGIKPGAMGSLSSGNLASAVSKIVDEADTAQVVQENRLILIEAEEELWELIGIMHNTLLGSPLFDATSGMSEDLEVSISFEPDKPIIDPKEQRENLKFKLDNGLTSYMRALSEANPDLSQDELIKLKAEIDAEKLAKTPPQLQVEPNLITNNNEETIGE